MGSIPGGSADTGGGSSAGLQHEGWLELGAGLMLAGAAAGGLGLRRRASVVD
jgi:hypothetical protein